MEEITEEMKKVSLSDKSKKRNTQVGDIAQSFKLDFTLYDQFYNTIKQKLTPFVNKVGMSFIDYIGLSDVKSWIVNRAIGYIKTEEALIDQDHRKRDQLLTFFWFALITRNVFLSHARENSKKITSKFNECNLAKLLGREENSVKIALSSLILVAFLSSSIHIDLDVYFECDNGSVVTPIGFILETFAYGLAVDDQKFELLLVEELLKKGAYVDALNIYAIPLGGKRIVKGVTPLMILSVIEQILELHYQGPMISSEKVSKKSVEVSTILNKLFSLLLEYGANLKARIPQDCDIYGGYDSIRLAVTYNASKMVKLLVKENCRELNIPVKDDIESPLILAIMLNDFKKVEDLLESGVDINITFGSKKRKPIHIAVLNWNLPLVQLLRSHGADLNAKTGSKPEKLNAQSEGRSEIDTINFNVDNGVHGHTLLFSLITYDFTINEMKFGVSARKKFLDMLNYLLANGAMMSKEEYQYLIHAKKTNFIFDKLLRNCSNQKLLKELLAYAKLVKNNASANIIQQKITAQQAQHDRMISSSRSSRLKRRGRRCRAQNSRRNRKKKKEKKKKKKRRK